MNTTYKSNNKLIRNASIHKKAYCHNPFYEKNPKINLGVYGFLKKIKLPKITVIPWRFIKLFVLLSVSLFLLIWLLFFSSWFNIKKVNINSIDLKYVNSIAVEQIVFEQLKQTNYLLPQKYFFTFSKNDLLNTIKKNWIVDDIDIRKNYLNNTISISIIEKKLNITWCESDNCYYLDDQGMIITKSLAPTKIVNLGQSLLVDNNKINISANFLKFYSLASQYKQFSDLKVREYYVDNDIKSLKVKLVDGPDIYFNIDKKIENQVTSLNVILRDKIKKEDYKKMSYIDLRYGDKIYYK